MHRRVVVALVLLALVPLVCLSASHASAAPRWAPVASATIHPGVNTNDGNNTCTSNFVFTDGTDAYLGMAAHCTGGRLGADDCPTGPLPLGRAIWIQGASRPGRIAYTSWNAMLNAHRGSGTPCNRENDFALVRIDPRDRGKVNPSVPVWGGPTGLATTTSAGDSVYAFGNSTFRLGLQFLRPQTGVSLGPLGSWTFRSLTVTPSINGDSGSAVLGPAGRALGLFVVIADTTPPGNRNTLLAPALKYMYSHSKLDAVKLARGTLQFSAIPTRLLGTG